MFVPADERPEETSVFEPDQRRAVLGREMKIGLAVILVLLAVLGVVVVQKLNGPGQDVAAKTEEPPATTAGSDGEADTPLITPPGPATVMTATADSNVEPASGSVETWAVATDAASRGAAETNAPAASPPSFMPKSASAQPSPRYAGYGEAEPGETAGGASGATGEEGGAWQAGQSPPSDAQEILTTADPLADPEPAADVAADPAPGSESAIPGPSIAQTDTTESSEKGSSPSGVSTAANPLRTHSAVVEPPAEPSASSNPPASPTSGDRVGTESHAAPDPLPSYGAYSRSTYREPEQDTSLMPMVNSSEPAADLDSQPVVQNEDGSYTVQPGDNYWLISEKLYGTGAYFRALAEHNRKEFPRENRLPVGQTISAPSAEDLTAQYAGLCPKPAHRRAAQQRARIQNTSTPLGSGKVYVVREGDTLFDVAKFELGKAARWVEIYELNRDVLGQQFDYLTPGMQLVLPDDQPAGTLTQRPDQVYQR